jgi:transposase-like protein
MSSNQITCPKCHSSRCWKNGLVNGGNQRYICRDCKLNFTAKTDINYKHPSTKDERLKQLVLKLYLKGNSYRDIEDITNKEVSRNTVMRWVKKGVWKSKRVE